MAAKGKHDNDAGPKVRVREATRNDVDALIELNRVCYPQMAREQVVWARSHLLSHLRVFPQGQLVAEVRGKIVGACSSLIVNLGPDPLRSHTWAGITDSGYFTNHDPGGDTLYGADVYVHPGARGQGVGAALYEARRQLCRRLNLRRILAGGRIWNYCDYAEKFSPDEYARQVEAGRIRDLVLSFQLREGFVLKGIMAHYLRDPRSHNFASLIEWLNPDFRPRPTGARKVRVACVQYQFRKIKSFQDFANQVGYFVDIASDYKSDFVLLPELFTIQLLSQTGALSPQDGMKRLASYTPRIVRMARGLAKRYGLTLIAGSHPVMETRRLYNVSFICLPDGTVLQQPKLHVTPNERRWWGITGGNALQVIETPKARIGVLICYDAEFPEPVRYLAEQGMEILFVPFCTDNRQAYLRVRHCCHARAIENQIYVAMAGNVGNLPDVANMDINFAQAAVLTPSDFAFARDGIAAEADSNEETILVCDLDLDALHGARETGTVTPRHDLRKDLFIGGMRVTAGPLQPVANDEAPLGDQPDGLDD